MKARIIMTAALCVLVLSSCGKNSKKKQAGTVEKGYVEESHKMSDKINVLDSLVFVKNGGEITHEKFTGLLPAASGPGINYDLTLYHHKNSDEGVYKLVSTYIEGDKATGKDVSFYTYGRYYTMKGFEGDKNAEVIKLIPFEEDEVQFHLLRDGERALTMLTQDVKRIDSKLNYTLVRVSDDVERGMRKTGEKVESDTKAAKDEFMKEYNKAEDKVERGTKEAKTDIQRETREGMDKIESGAREIKTDVQRGTRETMDKIESGVKDATDDVKEGYEKVEDKVEQGAQDLKENVHKEVHKLDENLEKK